MELIINIPEDTVKELHERYIGFSDTLEGRILEAVANGTPLPN